MEGTQLEKQIFAITQGRQIHADISLILDYAGTTSRRQHGMSSGILWWMSTPTPS